MTSTRQPLHPVIERGTPFDRKGVGAMVERAGAKAGLAFPIHVHMIRHSTGYAQINRAPFRCCSAIKRSARPCDTRR